MEGYKTKFTPTEAIRAVDGLHRRRFYEMMKNGEISYESQGPEGKKRRIIDGSELARVFGDAFRPQGTQGTESGKKIKQIEHMQTTLWTRKFTSCRSGSRPKMKSFPKRMK
jgi:hypothetical protein